MMTMFTKVVVLSFVGLQGVESATSNYVDGACVENYEDDMDVFPIKSSGSGKFRQVQSDYSVLWEVSYHGNYKLLTNERRGELAVLWQCGTPKPEVENATHYFEIPIQSVTTTSTTYLPYIEMVGERRSLVGYYSSFDFVSSPCLNDLHSRGEILDGSEARAKLNSSKVVDLTLSDEFSASSVPVPWILSDTSEDSVLKTAEYVEVVGLFFNREAEATEAITRIVDSYSCLKDQLEATITQTDNTPKKILWGNYFSGAGGFSFAQCPNWYCDMLKDAGGTVLEYPGGPDAAELDYFGFPYLSVDQYLELAQEADLIISDGPLEDGSELLQQIFDTTDIPVFDTQGPLGSANWFERRLAEPDALLADFAHALWGSDFFGETHDFTFLRNVREQSQDYGDPVLGTCDDIDAPYTFSGPAVACTDDITLPIDDSSKSKKSSGNSTTLILVIVAILFVLLLALLSCFLFQSLRSPDDTKASPPTSKQLSTDEDNLALQYQDGGTAIVEVHEQQA